jgi:DNA-binding YbaB/EbfC family protein
MTPEADGRDDAIEPDHIVHPFTLPDDGEGGTGLGKPGEDPLAAFLDSGGGGGLDFGALMEQAAALQSQMLAAQEQAAETVIEGVSGGGVVRVSVTGGFEFQSVTIDPSAVDPSDVDMLQDLVLAALRHAVEQIGELQSGGGIDLGGLGLGDLFGGS